MRPRVLHTIRNPLLLASLLAAILAGLHPGAARSDDGRSGRGHGSSHGHFRGHQGHFGGHQGHFRGHHQSFRRVGFHHAGFRVPHFSFRFGHFPHHSYYYSYPYYYPHYDPYYRPYYYAPAPAYAPYGAAGVASGALDLNVKPRRAEVYVNGQYVGTADSLDGFPRYLWLEKGNYRLTFYLDGYETAVRDFTIFPGSVLPVHLELRPGVSTPPEQVAPQAPAQEEEYETGYEPPPPVREPSAPPRALPAPEPYRGGAVPRPGTDEMDLRGEPARVRLRVEPGDASVYLDGRFLGSGDELAGLHSALVVDPGEHHLEVVRPGWEGEKMIFRVEPGEEIDLAVRLERGAGV